MSTHSILFLDRIRESSKTSLNICFLELKSFLGTQKTSSNQPRQNEHSVFVP